MNHFGWLEEKKKQAAREKAEGRRDPSYAAMPVRMRYMGNTGAGEDGIVQPRNPTHMVGTMRGPRMLHEGEDLYNSQNGSVSVVPAKYSQGQLKNIERTQQIPGYALGGSFTPVSTRLLQPIRDANAFQQVADNASSSTTVQTKAPTSAPSADPASVANSLRLANAEAHKPYTPFSSSRSGFGISATNNNPMQPKMVQTEAEKIAAGNQFRVDPANVQTVQSVTAPAIQPPAPIQLAPDSVQNINAEMEKRAAATSTQTGTSPFSVADRYRSSALGRIASASRGDMPWYDATAQKNIDDLKATMDVEQQVTAQQATQTGLNPEAAAARQAMGRAEARQNLASAEAQAAIGKGQLQQEATNQLASESSAERQFQYGKNLDAAKMLIATKDPANIQQAAKIYNDTYPGTNVNFDQLISDVGAERFAQGMTDMATLASTFKSWDEAKTSAQGLNLLKTLGLDDAGAQQLFEGLSVNAIDEQWNTVSSSDWYKGLKPEDQQLISKVFSANLTGEVSLSLDSNGSLVFKDPVSGKTWSSSSQAETGNSSTSVSGSSSTPAGDDIGWTTSEARNSAIFQETFIDPLAKNDSAGEFTGETTVMAKDSTGATRPIRFDSAKYMKWRQERPNSPRTFEDYAAWYLGYENAQQYNAGQNQAPDTPQGQTPTEVKPVASLSTGALPKESSYYTKGTNGEGNIFYSDAYKKDGALSDNTRSFVNEYKGQVVTINGQQYRIDPNNPIRTGQVQRNEFNKNGENVAHAFHDVEVLWVQNMATGQWEPLNLGYTVKDVDENIFTWIKSTENRLILDPVKDEDGKELLPLLNIKY